MRFEVARPKCMKLSHIAFGSLVLTLVACGGAGVEEVGSVTGLVLDTDGNPVRGATVYVTDGVNRETSSNTSGSFSLTGVQGVNTRIRATIVKGSTTYYGENFAQVYNGEQTQNLNIVVMPESLVSTVQGTVTESRNGLRIQGARITAKPTTGSQFATVQTITDSNGNYALPALQSGTSYQIMASYVGFTSADVVRIPAAGVATTANLVLQPSTDGVIPSPTNLSAVAWTSPSIVTRDRAAATAISNVKAFIDPRFKSSSSRVTALGNQVEVQLFWDKFNSLNVLGYEIWRKRNTDAWVGLDFIRDPIAESYLDSDSALREDINYTYSVAGGNSNYPNTDNSKGDFSNQVTVNPLGDMILRSPVISGSNVTLNWQAVNGATRYTIYVFDEYPGVRVSSYANNFNNPATGTSWTYNLTPLASGRRYWYLIMGSTSDDSARTLSALGSFVAP